MQVIEEDSKPEFRALVRPGTFWSHRGALATALTTLESARVYRRLWCVPPQGWAALTSIAQLDGLYHSRGGHHGNEPIPTPTISPTHHETTRNGTQHPETGRPLFSGDFSMILVSQFM